MAQIKITADQERWVFVDYIVDCLVSYISFAQYVCRRVINIKDGNERVTEVQEIAGEIDG